MRMRKKPNLVPRMQKCADIQLFEPEKLKGKWLQNFPGFTAVHVELGCGKGRFTAETAKGAPDILFAAVERVPEAMVVGMERVKAENIKNVRFMDMDASVLGDVFADGEVDRIYINFCDPWPGGKKRAKRRLTAPPFLEIYRKVLKDGGEIHFKTDNLPLFQYSTEQFESCGYTLSEVTEDLHGGGVCGVMTDYEMKFYQQGIKINRCVAAKTE